ncbi:MAG: hypothetical protein RLZZ200_556 [Pseudomonadota bacterium]|jgi:hypothetical protein
MMFEHQMIQATGFANHGPVGARDGVDIRLRVPNYRGMRLSLLDGVEVTLDGVKYGYETNLFEYRGQVHDLASLRAATRIHWSMDEPGIVRVPLKGGLAPGVHEVHVVARVRSPYFPPELQPLPVHATRKATLILP